jgi:glycosyltransferase involved in cell wall biosynthesis
VSEGELRALYERAACLVYPSRYEGFGIPPLEAMACGCPVIASRAASLPEVCGDAALYVDPDDPRQLAAAIRRVLCEEGVGDDLRHRGLQRAKQWTWARSAAEILVALREATVR